MLEVCRRAKAYGTEAIFWVNVEIVRKAKESFKIIVEAIRNIDEQIPDEVITSTLIRFRNWLRL